MQEKGFIHFLLIFVIFTLIVGTSLFYLFKNNYFSTDNVGKEIVLTKISSPTLSPTPTPYQFPYVVPKITKSRSYRTVLVGDSIVATMGANANELRQQLINLYPENEFVNYNYGYGSTNILSLPQRLNEETTYLSGKNPSILSQGFDLIIIESFGFNPLSEFPLETGLIKQDEVLEESVQQILKEKPGSALAFMTPIAPSPGEYAKGVVDLSPEVRSFWAKERIAYIDNHRKFAEEKGIPVIDVYKQSLDASGVVDRKYIADDFIHPSKLGIELMSKTIADYIFENKIFPQ